MHYWSIGEVSGAIRSKSLSPVDLLEATLERIERLEPSLQSYALVLDETAHHAADAALTAIRRGAWRGPLHGVPVAIKDLYGTTDAPTSFGSSHLADHFLPRDAEVVRRLRDAGAVIVGKLRMSEAALTDHGLGLPVPINPWGEDTWVGTSSSGCAAAVAAGLCYAALGSDTGGSIRGPATATGLTGLKPTRGAIPTDGTLPLSRTLDTLGPFARSARDCRIVFEAMRRSDEDYRLSRGAKEEELGFVEGAVRLGIDLRLLSSVSTEIRTMIEATARAFTDLGANVVAVDTPDGTSLAADWVDFVGAEAATDLADLYPQGAADRYGPEVAYVLDRGRRVSSAEYDRIAVDAQRFRDDLDAVLEQVDVVLAPTVSSPSPTIADVDRMRTDYSVWNHGIMRLTCPVNFSGHPSLTIPTGFTDRGTPLGAQLIGRHDNEDLLLRLGEAFQDATDFHQHHPVAYP